MGLAPGGFGGHLVYGRHHSYSGAMAGDLAVGVVGFVWARALGLGDFARGRFGRWFGCFGELLAQESDVFEQRGLSLAVVV